MFVWSETFAANCRGGTPPPKFIACSPRHSASQVLYDFEGYGFFAPALRHSRQQLVGDCGRGCRDDRAFEDDGETAIWFELLDRYEEESADEDYH
jgi:hypothetical protein